MAEIADLVAYDSNGQIALIVEVKGRTETSRSWAARMRRNVLAHGLIPPSRFLLLALPDRFYLWKDAGNTPELVEPTYEIDAATFLKPYYDKAQISPEDLSRQSFELIVTSWLNEIIRFGISTDVPEEQQRILEESGLLEALKGGSVAIDVQA